MGITVGNSSFAARLKELREAAGISQYHLAELAGLSRQALNHLEAGKRQPTWETVRALARALKVSVEAFDEAVATPEPEEVDEASEKAEDEKKPGRGRKRGKADGAND